MNFKQIFLIGFRGVGKSHLGRMLAESLNYQHVDIDHYIVSQKGKSVSELSQNGQDWENFRWLETKALIELTQRKKIVVSCGGGIGVNSVLVSQEKQKEMQKSTFDPSLNYGQVQKEILQNLTETAIILLKLSKTLQKKRLKKIYNNPENLQRPVLDSEKIVEINHILSKYPESLARKKLISKRVQWDLEEYEKRKSLYLKLTPHKVFIPYEKDYKTLQEILSLLKSIR